jgi:hypothetical protein
MTLEQISKYIPRSIKNKKKPCVKESVLNLFLTTYQDFKWFRVYDKKNTKVVASIYFALFKDKIYTSICRVNENDIFDQRIGAKIGINRLIDSPVEFSEDEIPKLLPKNINEQRCLKDLITTFYIMSKPFIKNENRNTVN